MRELIVIMDQESGQCLDRVGGAIGRRGAALERCGRPVGWACMEGERGSTWSN